jgi:hypothetical protein
LRRAAYLAGFEGSTAARARPRGTAAGLRGRQVIAATEPPPIMGGFFGVILGLLILSLMVMWAIFPVLVLSKFNELLRAQREVAKALQWMVDHWKWRSGWSMSRRFRFSD